MSAVSLAVVLVYLLLPVLAAVVLYGVLRLAIRHGILDARRRWRDEQDDGHRPVDEG